MALTPAFELFTFYRILQFDPADIVVFSREMNFNSGSLGGSAESEPTQMEMFNFMWLIWDHYLPLTPTRND